MSTLFRVGAIIFSNKRLVLTKMKKKDLEYYVLPGGRVEDKETLEQGLIRELQEELGIKPIRFRLVYLRELNITGHGRGIEFYFFVEEYSGEIKKGFDPENNESTFESVEFIELDDLQKLNFHPVQLKDLLKGDKDSNFKEIKFLGLHDYP
jgi:8-oxo-dGTP pyrophosphatase MutT (NUDIX family)